MPEALPVTEFLVIPGDELEVTTLRSGGPGGQHVNTTDSRVRLRFAMGRSVAITETVKGRLRENCRSWLTSDDDLLLTCDTSRSQHQNLEEARKRLADAVRAALIPPRKRHATRPTKSSKTKRLEGKRGRKVVKENRGRVRED